MVIPVLLLVGWRLTLNSKKAVSVVVVNVFVVIDSFLYDEENFHLSVFLSVSWLCFDWVRWTVRSQGEVLRLWSLFGATCVVECVCIFFFPVGFFFQGSFSRKKM